MLNSVKNVLHNRQHAGQLLSSKLFGYKSVNTTIMAIPHGGIPVAREVAKILQLPFEIAFLKRIKHPGNNDLSLGAVTRDKVVLNKIAQSIPQDYLMHHVAALQRSLQQDYADYSHKHEKNDLRRKKIIIVDDVLHDLDELNACIHSIKKHNPTEIIVAAPVVSLKVVNALQEDNLPIEYLFTDVKPSKAYTYFEPLAMSETMELAGEANTYSIV